jgi:uncharacterized delta-60 repeat protein
MVAMLRRPENTFTWRVTLKRSCRPDLELNLFCTPSLRTFIFIRMSPAGRRVIRCAMAKTTSPAGDFGADLSPGIRVGGARFLLKRLIGRGETSEVWLARDVPAVRDVALKFLPRAFRSDENLLERLKREVQRNQPLKHPHIVATRELLLDYDSVAVAMEFVDGWSLATLKVDKLCRCYGVEEIEPWIRQLGAALEYAHNEFGVAHGDLKPANLLVSGREGIKVSDFGLAAIIRAESAKRGLARGISSGIGFLSPQQVMGGAPSERDDIYSLGATIFDLLTGTPPFYQGEIIAQICSLKPPAMSERLAELDIQSEPISPVWEDTVATCLAKDPAERPPCVSAVLQLLERSEVMIQSSAPAPAPEPPEPPEPAEEVPPADLVEASDVEVEATPPPEELPSADETHPRRKPALLIGIPVMLAVAGLAAALWFGRDWIRAVVSPATGLADVSFNIGRGADDGIRCLALQPDGKILIGGLFLGFNNVFNEHLARLNPNGGVDTAFAPKPPGRVHAVALQNDGKILMAGEAMIRGRARVRVVRLNADGQREPDWGTGTRLNAEVRTLAVQPDGKILVGGSFTAVSAKPQYRLVRLHNDGAPDDAFNIGAGASATVWAVAVQPDGKILAAGAFDRFNDHKAGYLVRLNPDGSFDPGFNIGPGADADILAVTLQKDGKILIGGKFAAVNGAASPRVARLNADGSVDASFKPGSGPDDLVQSIAVQPDGKILLGGGFVTVNGVARHGVARLNADGSLDTRFNNGAGASGYVWSVAVQPDGKVLVAGAFDSYGGTPCGKLVRLLN